MTDAGAGRPAVAATFGVEEEYAKTLGTTTDQISYKVESAGDTVYVALNRGDAAAQPPGLPSGTYTDLLTGATVQTPISLPPRSALVLQPH